MHGLVNRAIESFVLDTAGDQAWADVVTEARLGFDTFEAMFQYEDHVTEQVVNAAAQCLGKPADVLLEDIGTYLVTHPNTEALRRLLRFGGVSFVDFLHSLDELPDRLKMAIPDLKLPEMRLEGTLEDGFRLTCCTPPLGIGLVLVGILRAMADDYGALAILEHSRVEGADVQEVVDIVVHEATFNEGRVFELASVAT